MNVETKKYKTDTFPTKNNSKKMNVTISKIIPKSQIKPSIKTHNDIQHIYNLEEYIETDINNVNTNVKYIFFCIYKIEKHGQLPYLQYMLYRYSSGLMIFPFIKITNNNNLTNIVDDYIIGLTGSKQSITGFIEKDNQLHVFINITNPINSVNFKTREHKLWWCLIDEICNKNKILNYPIHKSVIDLFNTNKFLMYIKNNDKKNISIPTVLYLCDTTNNIYNFIKLNKHPKNKHNIKNSLIYKPLSKILSNKKWLYSRDTFNIARCCVFLNNNIKTIYNINYDKISTHVDLNNYKSNIITDVIFFKKTLNLEEFIVINDNNNGVLSFHGVDKNGLQ
jgi:hypothetical protein